MDIKLASQGIEHANACISLDTTEAQLLDLWLHGKRLNTQRVYRDEARRFLAFVGKPIPVISLADLQAYVDTLTGAKASRARHILAVKSLLSFAMRIGYARFNVGAAVHAPKPEDRLAERILTEEQVQAIIAATEANPRDHAMMRLLYHAGMRVSECVSLRWRNLSDGILKIEGKGEKTRSVRLSPAVFGEIMALQAPSATREDQVFPMTTWNAWDRVRRAARAAGVEMGVSPHFFRHSHASHALDHGAPLTTVRDTLGHGSIASTDRYLHARPGASSSDYLPS